MSSTTTTAATTTTAPISITGSNVSTLFPDVDTRLATSHRVPSMPNGTSLTNGHNGHNPEPELSGHDAEQIRLMGEVCIVLDTNDVPIGSASKKTCHLMTNISAGLLHRAFSVFLFDPATNKLLLQQRASEKITFPDMWTNTCCSHPLGVPGETGMSLEEAVVGVKRAAVRKLGQELGIKPEDVPVEKFSFLTRIHYLAPCGGDGVWGEHEIDYILFIRIPVTLDVNENEVRDTKYVSPEELKVMFEDESLKFTPWFKLICQSMLFEWWDALVKDGMEGLDKFKEKGIRRMLN